MQELKGTKAIVTAKGEENTEGEETEKRHKGGKGGIYCHHSPVATVPCL